MRWLSSLVQKPENWCCQPRQRSIVNPKRYSERSKIIAALLSSVAPNRELLGVSQPRGFLKRLHHGFHRPAVFGWKTGCAYRRRRNSTTAWNIC